MAEITWGKPKIEFAKLVNGEIPTTPNTWKELPTPKEGTTKLSTEKGEKKEAKIEGGEVIDTKTGKNKYTFEFELHIKRGFTRDIPDVDGVVTDNYAFRLTPEDNTLKGYLFEKTSVSVEENWSSDEGGTLKYTVEVLKPKTGNMVKPYQA